MRNVNIDPTLPNHVDSDFQDDAKNGFIHVPAGKEPFRSSATDDLGLVVFAMRYANGRSSATVALEYLRLNRKLGPQPVIDGQSAPALSRAGARRTVARVRPAATIR